MDEAKAVAAAHKLARLICAVLTKGQPDTLQGQTCCEERSRQRVLHHLNRRTQQLCMTLLPVGALPQVA